jgi:hypothetical protein
MNKKSVIRGVILGIAVPLLVALLFVAGFAAYVNIGFDEGFRQLMWRGQIANVLRIGLLGNLVLFVFMIRKNEIVARGIMLATLLTLTISLLI